MRTVASGAVALSILSALFVPPVTPAKAHFTEPVPDGWNDWAMRQYNVGGNRCCSPSDVYLYKGAWRYEYEGDRIVGVTLMFDTGMEVFVPSSRFVDRARIPGDINPTGAAVIWYYDITNQYCFDPPGPLT
jgi:hypothetical protein